MAATFSNPRLAALPCELMRGCSFADNFVTLTKFAENKGSVNGTGVTMDHGMTSDGNGYVDYDIVTQTGSFSVMIRFRTTTQLDVGAVGYLVENDIGEDNGFSIALTHDGVIANHNAPGYPNRSREIDVDYSDGEWHTITYVLDLVGLVHNLYVDSLAVVTAYSNTDDEIGVDHALTIGKGSGSDYFTGDIQKIRIFEQALTQEEHDLYHADTLLDFMDQPLAVYRCDDVCDDDVGHKIWDRTLTLNDLYKADRLDSAAFPTFEVDKYSFDLSDDYVSNWPTLPSAYTVVAALSTPQLPHPEITQENDSTLITALSTGGAHWGYLHNLAIHTGTLTQLQLYHTEYMHMYYLKRGRAQGFYHRLITEGSCKFAQFLDAGSGVFTDYSQLSGGIATLVTRSVGDDYADGCDFGSATSNVTFPHSEALQCADVTIAAFISGVAGANCTIVDKGTNYKFRSLGAGVLDFNGSTIAHATSTDDFHLAVVCKSGFKPRFFVNKVYIGEGTTAETPDDSDTTDLVIGNNNELNERCQHTLKQVSIYNTALSDQEIRALGNQAEYIGALDMETGNRIAVEETFTAATVDYDVDPGGPFQLIDVVVKLSLAASTPEDLVIKTIRTTTTAVTVNEYVYDLSLSSDAIHVLRFDKRLANNVTIGVDYPNSDGLTITVITTYQLDQSVA